MENRRTWRRLLAVVGIAIATAAGLDPGSARAAGLELFSTTGTSDKPQSKLWHHAGSWWACVNDDAHLAIYRLTGTTWTHKLDLQSAVVPSFAGGTSDVLWDGTHLFVAVFGTSSSKFYKLSWDPVTENYAVLPGFPVSRTMLLGAETIVIDKDSTGRLWAVFEGNTKIQAYYTTSADHTSWSSSPLAISDTVDPDDIATVVAFGGDKIGVLYSDQRNQRVCFRVHRDSDSPSTWQPVEVVRSGFGVTDDHLNAKADSQGQVYFAAKDWFDAVWVGRRDTGGVWSVTTGASGLDCGTRPILQLDESQNKLYVFYTRWEACVSTGEHSIEERVAYLDNLLFSLPTVVISKSGVVMNEVQGTKQVLPPGSLAVLCSGSDGRAYWTGWGDTSGIGGSDPGGIFPPPPAAPDGLAAQEITEGSSTRLLHWRLDSSSGSSASDASGNGHSGSLGSGFAAPHWSPGLVNNGLFFDGDDYVTANGSDFAFVGQSFTLEAWVKIDLTNSPGTGVLFYRGDVVHRTFDLSVGEPTIEFGWSTGDTTDVSVKASQSLRDGAWHHVAAVWNAATMQARIFVDGSQKAAKTMTSGPVYGDSWPLQVGAIVNGGLTDGAFAGSMDHVAIASTAAYSGSFDPPLLYPASSTRYLRLDWSPASSIAGIAGYQIRRGVNGGAAVVLNGTLTPNPWFVDFTPPDGYLDYGVRAVDGLTQPGTDGWVVQPYESNPPAVPAAPQNLGWSLEEITAEAAPFWLLDEGLGSVTADASGLEHTGQLGGPGNGDNAEPGWIPGVTGSALHFDGSNDVVEVADAATLRFTGSFTVESWVRRTQLGVAQAVIAKDEGSSKRNYLVLILSNGLVEFSWRDASGSSTRKATSSTGITDMNWHHVACVFEQPLHQSRIYLDGVQVAASTTNGTPYTGVQPLRFGARGASSGGGSLSDPLRGDLDLVRITPAARYTGSFTPETFLFGGQKRNAVRVTWGLPPSGMVQDYRVYRQLLPAGTNTLVATLPYVPAPSFLDTGPLPDQNVRYTIRARNSNNAEGPASAPLDLTMPQPVDAAGGPPPAPARLVLEPNPFNPSATVRFHLERSGPVDLALFDAKGRRVTSVVRGELAAGPHRVPVFTGREPRLASGVYFLRLQADGRETRLKAVLVR